MDPQQRRYGRKAKRDVNEKGGESDFSTQSFSKKNQRPIGVAVQWDLLD